MAHAPQAELQAERASWPAAIEDIAQRRSCQIAPLRAENNELRSLKRCSYIARNLVKACTKGQTGGGSISGLPRQVSQVSS